MNAYSANMNLSNNIDTIRQKILQTEKEAKRKPHSVLLLAVSKQQNATAIAEAFTLGIHDFAESYYQEALPKIQLLRQYAITWHFIGPIQSNKTKGIATHFNWVHSINRAKIALALNEHRPADLQPLNVCIHINVEPELSKSGIAPEEAEELARLISQLPQLKLRGLMTIAPINKSQQELYELFAHLKRLLITLNNKLAISMDTLSMGMSNDIVPAIKAGATIVRIGRALFGERHS